MQRGDREACEHRRVPRRKASVCPQRVVLGEPHVQIGVEPIGLADEYGGTHELLPENERDSAYQQGYGEGLQ